jgi:methyl-accepting chemotaxis protein
MRWPWTGVALVVVALAVTAAGCGGSGNESQTNPTAEWASGFCTAITDWTDSLKDVRSEFSDTSNLSQDGLESAAEDVRSATDTLVSDLKDLGTPDTPSGEDVKSAVDSLTTTVDDETAQIQETAQGVSSIADLPSAVSEISASLSALSTAFSQTLQTIDNADATGELRTALEDSPECADVSG